MKKTILLIFCVLGFFQVQAQKEFLPGFRAGVNISNISSLGGDYKTDFYLGFQGSVKLTNFYTFQPELNYSRQGSRNVSRDVYQYVDDNYILIKDDYNLQYVGITLINKLNIDEFNIQIGPGLDFSVNSKEYVNNQIEPTFSLGMGYDFTKYLGAEVRYKRGLFDSVKKLRTRYGYGDYMNNVFQVGVYYKLIP